MLAPPGPQGWAHATVQSLLEQSRSVNLLFDHSQRFLGFISCGIYVSHCCRYFPSAFTWDQRAGPSAAMVAAPFTAVGVASGVLALSKAAWKLGSSLSKLNQENNIVDTTVQDLAAEVKSLGNECDLVYAELEEVASKGETASPPADDVDGRMWDCLATQVEESSRTMHDLDLFVKSVRGEESSFIGPVQRQRKLDKSKDQIATIRTEVGRHTDNLRTTRLLIT